MAAAAELPAVPVVKGSFFCGEHAIEEKQLYRCEEACGSSSNILSFLISLFLKLPLAKFGRNYHVHFLPFSNYQMKS